MKRIYKLLISIFISMMILSLSIPAVGAESPVRKQVATFAELQSEIASAGETPTVLEITSDFSITETVKIGPLQDITLTDNGAARKISVDTKQVTDTFHGAFKIAETGKLTIKTSKPKEDSLLVFDGTNAKCAWTSNNDYQDSNGDFISCQGELVISGGTVQNFSCDEAWSGIITIGGPKASFAMYGGKITNNIFSNQFGGVIRIGFGAEFVLENGSITDNDVNPSGWDSPVGGQVHNAAVYIEAKGGDSHFVMHGGLISKNHGYFGGVFIGEPAYPDFTSIATMEMNGGTISDNIAEMYGGGVMVCGQADFTLNGGGISGNQALIGGGIAVYDLYVSMGMGQDFEQWQKFFPGKFTMYGGTVTKNKAVRDIEKEVDGGCGGGIYIASNKSVIYGGNITENTAQRQGGGVYVGSVPYVLHMYDALITQNTATILGGGLWFCPTGDAANTVTNGGAIFENYAIANDPAVGAAGDDFVAVPQENKNHAITLADRMLGGGEVQWYRDGGVKSTSPTSGNVLGLPDETPRYDPKEPGERITGIKENKEGIALKAEVTDAAKQLAKSKAKLKITGNTAPRGGGVGSNGGIVIGTPEDEWPLKVTKVWEEIAPADRKPVTIRMKIGDYQLDAVELNEKNNWTGTFNQLPNPDSLGDLQISVVEEGNEYEASYSVIQKDEANKLLAVTVTNRPAKPQTGGLSVSKTVSGAGADPKQAFQFQVTLNDTSVNGIYGEMEFQNGVAEFSLKHGETITALGLPAGLSYEVTEHGYEGYTVTSEHADGMIPVDSTAEVVFKNHKDKAPVSEPDDPSSETTDPEKSSPDKTTVPKTGDLDIRWFIFLLTVGSGIVLLVTLKLRKETRKQ